MKIIEKRLSELKPYKNNPRKNDEIVLDCFGGSGSTMIASEQLGRVCYMVELDPKYCDVIIDRYKALTGLDAFKIEENK